MIDPPPIQGFLSYSSEDDKTFDFVKVFTSKLKALVLAKSGRPLNIFVDQNDIEWGANWRDRLDVEIENALLFIPLLSANYLLSEHCREEFLAFHSKAKILGVTELLLPILLIESPLFVPRSDDEVVRLAEERQWKSIEPAVLGGSTSPVFMPTIADLAGSLLDSLSKAEERLGRMGADDNLGNPQSPRHDDEESVRDDNDDGATAAQSSEPDGREGPPALAELLIDLEDAVNDMTAVAHRLGPTIEELGTAAEEGGTPSDHSPRGLQSWSGELAKNLMNPARDLETDGRELYLAVSKADRTIEGFRLLIASTDAEIGDGIRTGLEGVLTQFGDMAEAQTSLMGLLTSLKPAEVVSVPMRMALAPARRGLTAVTDSLRLIQFWQGLDPDTLNSSKAPSSGSRMLPQDRLQAKRSQPKRSTRKGRR